MRKTRILLLTALLLAGVMFLSSCGIGGSTLKLKTLLDGATYVDPDPAFSTAAEVADLKNADLEETRGDLALFIAETEVDSSFYDKYIVYNVKTGTVVFTATESELVDYSITIDAMVNKVAYTVLSTYFTVWTTTYTKEGDVVNYDKYTDSTAIYNADGSQIATAARDTYAGGALDLLYFEGKMYRLGEDGKYAYAFDYSPLSFFPNIIFESEKYYLAAPRDDERAALSSEMFFSCYDKELNLLGTYAVPSYIEIGAATVLENGNFLVQGVVEKDPYTEEYDFYDRGEKYDLYTLIIDVKKGEVTALESNYLIDMALPVSDRVKEEAGFGDEIDNIAFVAFIENKRINESAACTGTFNNKGEFLPIEKINGMNPGEIIMVAENRWLAGTREGYTYLIDEKGKVLADVSWAEPEAGYLDCDGKLYNYDLEVVFDYEAEKLYGYAWYDHCVIFENDDEELILFANGQKSTLVAKDSAREYVRTYSTGDYFVICDATDPAAIKYEIYNNAGAKILTLDYNVEAFDISFVSVDTEGAGMICVTGWDLAAADYTYTYYRLA